MGWDIDVREKIYLRLANEIFFRILHGEYAQGEKLPSYAELAKKAGCSPETVRKAIRELQQQGVVENLRVGYQKGTNEAETASKSRAVGNGAHAGADCSAFLRSEDRKCCHR